MINWFNMGEQKKESAPWHTGLIEGVVWGGLTYGALLVSGAVVAGLAVGSVAVTAGLSGVVFPTCVASIIDIGATIVGVATFGKTIFEKRHEYEQAHSVIENASYDGRVNNINQSRGK
jgi:hypothetical protein